MAFINLLINEVKKRPIIYEYKTNVPLKKKQKQEAWEEVINACKKDFPDANGTLNLQ